MEETLSPVNAAAGPKTGTETQIYETDCVVSLAQLEQYYKAIKLPKILLNVQQDTVQKITPIDIKGAIQKMASAKA
ncbi:hypothetical protein NDU88_004932 [Pleurodeles waltl]|uniref:CBS domain-containing protein n=1 Tax=Pleurodeles waltl TaxID=8319 RepID=A0AAV7QGS9_PLEWA|nr:hypothetical protein NDU88_004932 [Pleurodeles waltl]